MTTSKEYTRKVKKTGNSIQASIPADIANHLNIQEGDTVIYKLNSNGEVMFEKEKSVYEQMGVGEDFVNILQEGMTEYKDLSV